MPAAPVATRPRGALPGGRYRPIYSLGVVLDEMLRAISPFDATTPVAGAVPHLDDTPEPTSQAVAVPPRIATACDSATEREPARRPPSAVSSAPVRGRAAGLPPAPPRRRSPRGGVPLRRDRPLGLRRGDVAAACLVGLGILGFVLVPVAGPPGDQPQRGASPPMSRPPRQRPLVPPVVGGSIDQAQAALVNAGLRIGSILVIQGPKNVVVRTDPPVGSPIRDGAAITLFVGGD